MKRTFILFLFLSLTSILSAQGQTTFQVPQNVVLKTKADYPKYDKAIINAANWLEETDLDKDTNKRQKVNAFVIKWISGSPTITVDINEQLGNLFGNNAQLMCVYLASYARNFLKNKGTATKFTATKAGLMSIMKVYKKGIGVSPNKEMDKLIKLAEKNKLDDYIKHTFE